MSANHKKDGHYQRAKKEGYRARSAYKLLEIQKRYNIFKRAFYILDLGCAPGSWLQVSKTHAEDNLIKYKDQFYYRDHYKIMGIDIQKIIPIEGINFINFDFTNPEVNTKIKFFFQDKLDLILSDASINKTGIKLSDNLRQVKLCQNILELSQIHLKIKGNLVMKAFQGVEFEKLVEFTRKKFKILKLFKPKSSKKASNEIYLIGLKQK
ncbi:MAG: SAM-dependent methyltransferase [Promethearchaeota archaeon]